MHTPQLLDYIRQQTAMGSTKENIQKSLTASGWSQPDIDAAFAAVASEPVKKRGIVSQILRGIFYTLGILFLLMMIGGGILAVHVLNHTKSNIENGTASESEKGFYTSINAALIQGALLGFNATNKTYPNTLDELIPKYIQEIPNVPTTNQPFRYTVVDGGAGYTLCTTKNGQDACATASTSVDGKPLDY